MNGPTEISDFQFSFGSKEQVLRFYITVDNFLFVAVVESFCKFLNVFSRPVHREKYGEMRAMISKRSLLVMSVP